MTTAVKDHPVLRDPIERIVAEALTAARIPFTHEHERGGGLDFELTGTGIFIECKQFHAERIGQQIAPFPNVIVIQGRAAAEWFARSLRSVDL